MAFVERRLDIAIKLSSSGGNQPNVFAGTGTNQVTLTGHRASLKAYNSGAAAGSRAELSVWGLTPSLMDQLSTLGMVVQMIARNTLTVTAGDAGGMSTVFVGTIIQAYADYNGAPDVPFKFECLAGAAEQVIPYPATSYRGATDVATILSAIANKMGWGFENNGVSDQLTNPYFAGSPMQQVKMIARQVHINAMLINNVLAIWPRWGARTNLGTPLVAPPPSGQMIGYPTYTQQGLMLKTVFDPRISMGGQIEVRSDLKKATGTWNVYKVDHVLEALKPRGEWMSTLYVYNPKYPAPLPPQTG